MEQSLTIMENHLKINKEGSLVLRLCYRLSKKFTSNSQKVGGCRYFGEKFDVLPGIMHALDLSAQNTVECYRRMLKNNFLYQWCNKICEKQLQEFIVDHEQQIQYAVCKTVTVANVQDQIKEILLIAEEDSYLNTDELLKSCVH